MSVTKEIYAKLQAAFDPLVLELEDESEKHRGHGGYQEGGESHFNLRISSVAFEGMNRVQRHRAVHGAIGPEIMNKIHALALHIEIPEK